MLTNLRQQIFQLSSTQITILTIWALLMISIPVIDWSLGWSAMVGPITLGVTITAVVVLALVGLDWGVAITLKMAVLILAISWTAEAVGSRYGFPFGVYNYTDVLRPQVLGVPI